MVIKNSPVINDDVKDYPEESVKNKEREIEDYLYELEKETDSFSEPEPYYEDEKPYEEITPKVDPELPGNISFSFV